MKKEKESDKKQFHVGDLIRFNCLQEVTRCGTRGLIIGINRRGKTLFGEQRTFPYKVQFFAPKTSLGYDWFESNEFFSSEEEYILHLLQGKCK